MNEMDDDISTQDKGIQEKGTLRDACISVHLTVLPTLVTVMCCECYMHPSRAALICRVHWNALRGFALRSLVRCHWPQTLLDVFLNPESDSGSGICLYT